MPMPLSPPFSRGDAPVVSYFLAGLFWSVSSCNRSGYSGPSCNYVPHVAARAPATGRIYKVGCNAFLPPVHPCRLLQVIFFPAPCDKGLISRYVIACLGFMPGK